MAGRLLLAKDPRGGLDQMFGPFARRSTIRAAESKIGVGSTQELGEERMPWHAVPCRIATSSQCLLEKWRTLDSTSSHLYHYAHP